MLAFRPDLSSGTLVNPSQQEWILRPAQAFNAPVYIDGQARAWQIFSVAEELCVDFWRRLVMETPTHTSAGRKVGRSSGRRPLWDEARR